MKGLPFLVLLAAPSGPLADFLGAFREILRRLLVLPEQASAAAPGIDGLQYLEFSFFLVLGGIVLGAAGWLCLRYRRGRSGESPTPQVKSPVWLEVGVGLFLLAAFCLFWVIGFRQYVDASVAPPGALDVYVTGRQWVWKFTYGDGQSSAGVLYVPRDRPVRLLLTSRDVIHSFFVPAFRIKQDAVPGRYTSIWFTATREGSFQVFCAELCGAGHSRMWARVVVLPGERFDAWLAGQMPEGVDEAGSPPVAAAVPDGPTHPQAGGGWATPRGGQALPAGGLARRGLQAAALAGCLRCHSTDGTPHIGPTWLGLYGSRVRLEGGGAVLADEAYLTRSMMDPMTEITAGFSPTMPSYQGRLDPAETAAILAYIKYLREPEPDLAGVIPPETAPASGEPGQGAAPREEETP